MFQLTTSSLGQRRAALVILLLLGGLQQMASAGYIQAKAHLAQVLIGWSWQNSLAAGGTPQKPWPWADTWPIARLEVPQSSVDLYVLSGSAGHALAFGPGHEPASAKPGEPGLSLIGGHRDTHFSFLRDMNGGERFSLQLPSGERLDYRVSDVGIVDINRDPLPVNLGEGEELLLVTCYPFDALVPGGPLRFVVRAQPARAKTHGL
ncbi:MAG: class GN sortase [Halioglobus sp.]